MTEQDQGEPYDVKLATSVSRAISETLPESVAWAALGLINGPLLANPYRVGAPLEDELAGKYGARIGPEYRLVYRIDDEQRIVEVLRIGRRADVYGIS